MKLEANNVTEELFDKLGPLLSLIGEQAAADLGGDPEGIYIYAEAGEGWHSCYVFRREGDAIQFYWASAELKNLVWQLWNLGEPGKRWSLMEYQIRGDKFEAEFKYPHQVDVEEFELDRRSNFVRARFGDLPVIFPPLPNDQ